MYLLRHTSSMMACFTTAILSCSNICFATIWSHFTRNFFTLFNFASESIVILTPNSLLSINSFLQWLLSLHYFKLSWLTTIVTFIFSFRTHKLQVEEFTMIRKLGYGACEKNSIWNCLHREWNVSQPYRHSYFNLKFSTLYFQWRNWCFHMDDVKKKKKKK